MAVKWLDEPESHDYDAAAHYLSMVAELDVASKTVRGEAARGAPLQVVDCYRRVRARYIIGENTTIPCLLVSWQG